MFDQLNLNSGKKYEFSSISPSEIYSICSHMGISNGNMAQYIADFLKLPYISHISPEDVQLGALPTQFCRSNHVVAVSDNSTEKGFVLSNPFDWDLLDNLKKFTGFDEASKLIISEPNNIDLLFKDGASTPAKAVSPVKGKQEFVRSAIKKTPKPPLESEVKEHSSVYLSNSILDKAVSERASDVHIEPKETGIVVRFRIDGDSREILTLKRIRPLNSYPGSRCSQASI